MEQVRVEQAEQLEDELLFVLDNDVPLGDEKVEIRVFNDLLLHLGHFIEDTSSDLNTSSSNL